jgi:putative methyltransferase (TIGR04325 family)
MLFEKIEHSLPVLAGLLRAAADNKGKLSILDFGGSLGSSYRQCREFLSAIEPERWSVVEQPSFVRCGKDLFEDEVLRFYGNIEECCVIESLNILPLSSVLQYLENSHDSIARLAELGVHYIIIDRTPFGDVSRDRLTVQKVPSSIYKASYPAWIFSESRLHAHLARGYTLLSDFTANEPPLGRGESRVHFRGFLLQKK